MLFRIDPTSAEPLFAQLAAQVRAGVLHGELRPGTRLPSARDLAASLDVNLHTVLRAYQDLRDEGLLDLRRGRGAVVSHRPPADLAPVHDAVAALVAAAGSAGLAPSTTLSLVKDALAPQETR
ncbi:MULTISPECIES: GntR family transcriptional regulator [unclassified Cellulomonas]|uniref:GntR family transcriptional regulator n=1 Tax=unclassified Cellulomonas TaxID=2620175 RepID=UPI0019A32806|nr:GntR family transcriptional regulator [Cellulomonas sp. ES6]MBD3779825.1 GntR family transcriptional regulator [Micrococcales bacterium]WHP18303.1 GntR family transcriptional regulator [Cellulomonas sp. ES6]